MKKRVFDNTSTKLLINKSCPLSGKDAPMVDYKNIDLFIAYEAKKIMIDWLKKNYRQYIISKETEKTIS